jgi:hypothetical protein
MVWINLVDSGDISHKCSDHLLASSTVDVVHSERAGFHVVLLGCQGVFLSNGKDVGEVVGKQGENEEPYADRDEYPSTPRFDPWCLDLDTLDRLILGSRHDEGSGKDQANEDDRSDYESK